MIVCADADVYGQKCPRRLLLYTFDICEKIMANKSNERRMMLDWMPSSRFAHVNNDMHAYMNVHCTQIIILPILWNSTLMHGIVHAQTENESEPLTRRWSVLFFRHESYIGTLQFVFFESIFVLFWEKFPF